MKLTWLTRKTGSKKQKGLRFPVVPRSKFLAAKRKPTFKLRPAYILKDGKVQPAVFEDGQVKVVEGEEAKDVGSLKRGYKTPSQTCPDLTPTKMVQRQEVAEKLSGGTVLEAFAGKGELSEKVYADKADKIVLVDKDEKLLEKADKRLDGKVKHEAVASDNVEWLENEMSPEQLKNLKLVDFDAFGSPAKQMRAFFKNFPVRRKMFVTVTDGSKIFLGYKKGYDAMKWLRQNYGIQLKTNATREDQIRILDAFMKAQGQVYGFNVRPINAAFGKHHAVYAGYELTPK